MKKVEGDTSMVMMLVDASLLSALLFVLVLVDEHAPVMAGVRLASEHPRHCFVNTRRPDDSRCERTRAACEQGRKIVLTASPKTFDATACRLTSPVFCFVSGDLSRADDPPRETCYVSMVECLAQIPLRPGHGDVIQTCAREDADP